MRTGRRRQVSATPWVDLIVKILDRAPRLPEGLCVGRPEVFDAADAESVQQALRLCARCPERVPCARWAESLPRSRRPPGVLAGRWCGSAVSADDTTVGRQVVAQ